MASMIENLMGGPVKRKDEKRLLPSRRPLPSRPRDLLELFVTLGAGATLQGLIQSADFREAEPRALTYIALSRWPNAAEIPPPEEFNVLRHLRGLLTSREFREPLFRRLCDAYPERPRLLYVRIPRCAGAHFLATTAPMHPLFPPELTAWHRNDGADFFPALGTYLGRFTTTKSIMAVQPNQADFLGPPPSAETSAAPIPWHLNPPPYRAGDRLFAIIREPRGLILSLVNALTARLAQPPELDDAETLAYRDHLAPSPDMPPADLARQILRAITLRNPLCTALGDGTAKGALALSRVTDIELADLTHYQSWIRYTWDTDTALAIATGTPALSLADLTADDTEILDGLIAEDLTFYEHATAALAKLGDYQSFIRGRHL